MKIMKKIFLVSFLFSGMLCAAESFDFQNEVVGNQDDRKVNFVHLSEPSELDSDAVVDDYVVNNHPVDHNVNNADNSVNNTIDNANNGSPKNIVKAVPVSNVGNGGNIFVRSNSINTNSKYRGNGVSQSVSTVKGATYGIRSEARARVFDYDPSLRKNSIGPVTVSSKKPMTPLTKNDAKSLSGVDTRAQNDRYSVGVRGGASASMNTNGKDDDNVSTSSRATVHAFMKRSADINSKSNLKAFISELEISKKDLEASLDEEQDRVIEINNKLTQLTRSSRKERRDMEKEIESLKNTVYDKNSTIAELNIFIEEQEKDKEKLEEKLDEANANAGGELEGYITELENNVAKLSKKNEELTADKNSLCANIEDMKDNFDQERSDWEYKEKSLNDKISSLAEENDQLAESISNFDHGNAQEIANIMFEKKQREYSPLLRAIKEIVSAFFDVDNGGAITSLNTKMFSGNGTLNIPNGAKLVVSEWIASECEDCSIDHVLDRLNDLAKYLTNNK